MKQVQFTNCERKDLHTILQWILCQYFGHWQTWLEAVMNVTVMQYDSIKLAMIVDIKTNLAYIRYNIIPGRHQYGNHWVYLISAFFVRFSILFLDSSIYNGITTIFLSCHAYLSQKKLLLPLWYPLTCPKQTS